MQLPEGFENDFFRLCGNFFRETHSEGDLSKLIYDWTSHFHHLTREKTDFLISNFRKDQEFQLELNQLPR